MRAIFKIRSGSNAVSRLSWFRFIGVGGVFWAAAFIRLEAAVQPNIVFIMADDAGLGDYSPYGGTEIKTPAMEKMAAEGMLFQNAYSGSAVCAPTRCVLMTGLHTGHCLRRANRSPISGLIPLEAGTPTVASMLKNAGYATGGFGKWGLGNPGTDGVPEKLGFDLWYGYYDQVHAHNYYPEYLIRNGSHVPLAGNLNGQKKEYTHYLVEDETIKFIEDHQAEPFFVYAAWTPPHGDYVIPENDPAMDFYRDKPWSQKNKNYAAMVTRLDAGVARVLEKLKELKIEDRTLVIYTSDNGANGEFKKVFNSTAGLRGQKRSLYEGGTRAPFVARWPGVVPAGSTSALHTSHLDLMATAAEIAGVQPPILTDGISILPTLKGKPQEKTHPYLYFEIYEGLVQQSLREGDWKGYRKGLADLELYNLADDPGESKNLAALHPEMVAKFLKIMAAEHVPSPHFIGPTQLQKKDEGRKLKAKGKNAG